MTLITMTHTIGSDAMTIARIVADGLNIEVYGDARLKEEALRMGLHTEQLRGFEERPPDWIENLWSGKPEIYLKLMESVIYEAARLGQGVIIGHGSQMLLHDFGCAMHVLVTAQEESRIQRLVADMALSREAARKLIRRSDNQKRGFFRYAFHKDWDDPTLYDVCVNPDKMGSERAAQLIIDAARSPGVKSCGALALDALERHSKTSRIQASLMEMDIRHFGLRVDMPEKDVALISGVIYQPEDKARIPAVVGKIPGVERVQMDVTLVPAVYS